jgi:uncharacterized membrane protein YhaH (DUF805 family)
MNEYLNVIRNNYANFTGRARRREYWMFTLINTIIVVALELVAVAGGYNPSSADVGSISPLAAVFLGLAGIYALAVLVPSLAVTVRRLHDAGYSGWVYLIGLIPFIGGIVLLVFTIMDSKPGANKWGPNPKGQGVVAPRF